MRETRTDTSRALLQALGLHVVLFALMFAGLHWTRSNVAEAAQGDVIEADLIDPSALSAAMRSALQRDPRPVPQPQPVEEPVQDPVPEDPPPETLPDPVVEEPVPPAPVPEPDPVDQDRVMRDADSDQVARVDREQEAKRRQQEQVDLDARKREQQLAEIRRQRALAARERTQAEMRAQQLADARNAATAATQADAATSRPPGNPTGRSSQSASYQAALMNAILRQWTRPESVEIGQVCQVLIRQIPGGEVVDVQISPSCPYDELGRRSVEAAILKASPLPYAGFEDVFVRNPVLKFRAEDL